MAAGMTDWAGVARREAAAVLEETVGNLANPGRETILAGLAQAYLAGARFGLAFLAGDMAVSWTDAADGIDTARQELAI